MKAGLRSTEGCGLLCKGICGTLPPHGVERIDTEGQAVKSKAGILLIAIAYAGYVLLGLSYGLLSVAWPSIRELF